MVPERLHDVRTCVVVGRVRSVKLERRLVNLVRVRRAGGVSSDSTILQRVTRMHHSGSGVAGTHKVRSDDAGAYGLPFGG